MSARPLPGLILRSLLILAGVAAVLCLVNWTTRDTLRIHLSLPSSHRGLVCIREDPQAAFAPRSDRVVTLEIPESGELRVRSIGFISEWHIKSARFRDGAELAFWDDRSTRPYDAQRVGIRSCVDGSTRTLYFHVGRFEDAEEFDRLVQLDGAAALNAEREARERRADD